MKAFAALVFVALVLFALALMVKKGKGRGPWPYKARKLLMTEPEQVLFWRLDEALPGLIVLAQVAMNRVIEVKRGTPQFMRWFGLISAKSLDFVVCRKDGSTLLAIELDDESHRDPKRQKGDEDKGRALAAAGVPLIRWHVKAIPDVEQIRREVAGYLVQQSGKQADGHGLKSE